MFMFNSNQFKPDSSKEELVVNRAVGQVSCKFFRFDSKNGNLCFAHFS